MRPPRKCFTCLLTTPFVSLSFLLQHVSLPSTRVQHRPPASIGLSTQAKRVPTRRRRWNSWAGLGLLEVMKHKCGRRGFKSVLYYSRKKGSLIQVSQRRSVDYRNIPGTLQTAHVWVRERREQYSRRWVYFSLPFCLSHILQGQCGS